MKRDDKLSAADIRQWIDNDEGLYLWRNEWVRRNKGGTRAFISENRAELEACIRRALSAGPIR